MVLVKVLIAESKSDCVKVFLDPRIVDQREQNFLTLLYPSSIFSFSRRASTFLCVSKTRWSLKACTVFVNCVLTRGHCLSHILRGTIRGLSYGPNDFATGVSSFPPAFPPFLSFSLSSSRNALNRKTNGNMIFYNYSIRELFLRLSGRKFRISFFYLLPAQLQLVITDPHPMVVESVPQIYFSEYSAHSVRRESLKKTLYIHYT